MRILKILTLRGPNQWSVDKPKLVVLRLDLEESVSDREVAKVWRKVCDILPGLGQLRQTLEVARSQNGTGPQADMMSLPQTVQLVALQLQRQTGMAVDFGLVRDLPERHCHLVVFEYVHEAAARYAARAAVRMCQSILEEGDYPDSELQQDLADLTELRLDAQLGPSTESIVAEAVARGIPWLELGTRALVQLGYGAAQKRIQATLTGRSGILGVELACDKEGTKTVLRDAGVPVPKGTTIRHLEDLESAILEVGGFPIVIKPLNGNHGRGVSIDVRTPLEAEDAFAIAAAVSPEVIVERFHRGRDHRVLVVNHKVVAVAERVPAHVIGDGRSTVQQLVDLVNQDPRRGEGHDNVLTKIVVDRTSLDVLQRQGYRLDSVVPANEIVYLRATANLSTGGISVDRTDDIHPENVWLAERISKLIGLDIAGIDIVTEDISRPLADVDGAVVEVNAAPGFRMHTAPSAGQPRNVAAPVLDMLFPAGTAPRIPIVAVTGTNGKTTTTRAIARIFRETGKVVGYTTTDGIYIGSHLVQKGDTTGPQSARTILCDPTVEVAVLESARGGIIRSGLAFDACDVGVITNVQADHLGSNDVYTLEDMARVKAVVAQAVRPDGYVVLNADDERVAAMAKGVRGQVAFFSLSPTNPTVQAHVAKGGGAAVYADEYLCILKGDWTLRIERAAALPMTLGGRATFMIQNALAAALAAFCQGVRIEDIRTALMAFDTSAKQTPGRMNLFDLGRFQVLVDYAHNPAGFRAVQAFLQNWSGTKIGVIGAPGDRRNADIEELAELATEMFDWVIVKEDVDLRGRVPGEVARLMRQRIAAVRPNLRCEEILDERAALKYALESAPDGALVAIFPEKVEATIAQIEAVQPPHLKADRVLTAG